MAALNCISGYLKTYGSRAGARGCRSFSAAASTLGSSLARGQRTEAHPFPAQALAIMGIVERWEEARCAAAVAECVTGKTLISLGSVFTHAAASGSLPDDGAAPVG